MRNILLVFALVGSMGFSNLVFAASVPNAEIVFKQDGENENAITLNFKGTVYKDKRTFAQLEKQKAPLSDAQKLVMKAVKYNTDGDVKSIVSLWAPGEQAHIKKKVENQKMLKRNTSFYRNILSSRFVAVMNYGKYTFCFVMHDLKGAGPYMKTYPLVHEGKSVYLSNSLVGDFFYDSIVPRLEQYFLKNI